MIYAVDDHADDDLEDTLYHTIPHFLLRPSHHMEFECWKNDTYGLTDEFLSQGNWTLGSKQVGLTDSSMAEVANGLRVECNPQDGMEDDRAHSIGTPRREKFLLVADPDNVHFLYRIAEQTDSLLSIVNATKDDRVGIRNPPSALKESANSWRKRFTTFLFNYKLSMTHEYLALFNHCQFNEKIDWTTRISLQHNRFNTNKKFVLKDEFIVQSSTRKTYISSAQMFQLDSDTEENFFPEENSRLGTNQKDSKRFRDGHQLWLKMSQPWRYFNYYDSEYFEQEGVQTNKDCIRYNSEVHYL
ncbi:hypothetical protein EAG_03222 [Camponotus floridanus]|uniref:Uncharacterized protein n=1 Tax=Camponotus floridanus TaxID=104421 RepID=E2A673_CAMFO|nr:hypothetical protein EAG_03222 [Camponotus floridanus]